MTRCEIILALDPFHRLHQEDDSVVTALIELFENQFHHNPAALGWKEQSEPTERSSLLEGLRYAWDFAHHNQHEVQAFVLLTTLDCLLPKDGSAGERDLRYSLMQRPPTARAVIVVMEEMGIDIESQQYTWLEAAVALAPDESVLVAKGNEVLTTPHVAEFLLAHLAIH